jgi:hypothetical protein
MPDDTRAGTKITLSALGCVTAMMTLPYEDVLRVQEVCQPPWLVRSCPVAPPLPPAGPGTPPTPP